MHDGVSDHQRDQGCPQQPRSHRLMVTPGARARHNSQSPGQNTDDDPADDNRLTREHTDSTKIFDLEVAFLFPWAVVIGDIGWFGFWSVMIFLAVLTVGFIYEWRKGALEWD